MLMGSRGDAQDEQGAWLTKRHACGNNIACLSGVYKMRIEQLNSIIAGAMQDYCVKLGIC
jgi:uncharacterized protein